GCGASVVPDSSTLTVLEQSTCESKGCHCARWRDSSASIRRRLAGLSRRARSKPPVSQTPSSGRLVSGWKTRLLKHRVEPSQRRWFAPPRLAEHGFDSLTGYARRTVPAVLLSF